MKGEPFHRFGIGEEREPCRKPLHGGFARPGYVDEVASIGGDGQQRNGCDGFDDVFHFLDFFLWFCLVNSQDAEMRLEKIVFLCGVSVCPTTHISHSLLTSTVLSKKQRATGQLDSARKRDQPETSRRLDPQMKPRRGLILPCGPSSKIFFASFARFSPTHGPTIRPSSRSVTE